MGARQSSQRAFQIHASAWFAVNAFLFMIWLLTTGSEPWFLYPAGGWGIALAIHAVVAFNTSDDDELEPGASYRELT